MISFKVRKENEDKSKRIQVQALRFSQYVGIGPRVSKGDREGMAGEVRWRKSRGEQHNWRTEMNAFHDEESGHLYQMLLSNLTSSRSLEP